MEMIRSVFAKSMDTLRGFVGFVVLFFIVRGPRLGFWMDG